MLYLSHSVVKRIFSSLLYCSLPKFLHNWLVLLLLNNYAVNQLLFQKLRRCFLGGN